MDQLTDRTALLRHRARAAAMAEPALFLHEAVADSLQERLEEVNRSFTAPAIVTPWPDLWAARMPQAKIVSDEDVLTLDNGAHDLVIHALCLHWANDVVGQLIQCRHALRPDGLFIGATFGGQTLHELRATMAESEVAVTGGLSPRVAPMAEIRDVGGLLQRAGFALPVADSLTFDTTYANAFHLLHDLRAMGETSALAARLRRFTRRNVLTEMATRYAESFGSEDGRIPATFEVITLTGWAPSADQPQPLRPGSATTRLAEALGTTEKPLDSSDV